MNRIRNIIFSNKLHKNNKTTSILISPTDNKSIKEVDITNVSMYANILTLPEYKDTSYEKVKEILVKSISNKFHNNIQHIQSYTSTSTNRSIMRDQYSESSSDSESIENLDFFSYNIKNW